jgi:aminoglycoside phosphotransferase (APT) family kinase protein
MTTPDRTIAHETLERMIRTIRPDWRVREAELAESGFASVYHVAAGTPTGTRECVLKASPDGDRHGIDAEARLLAVLTKHTDLPVPGVLGTVDEHGDLPAPFFVMESMPGTAVPFEGVGTLSDAALERSTRETGAYLAELHSLDVVDEFGVVSCERTDPLRGGRPSGDFGMLTVADARDSWPALVREWADDELDRHASTRFGDLTPRLRSALDTEIDALSGSFAPVLGRIDHGLHNLLVEPDTGRLDAMLDWAFTLAVTPAYDLSCVEFVLGGRARSGLADTPDRHRLVRTALLDGYRSSTTVPGELDDHRRLYDLLMYVRSMNHLDAGVAAVADEHLDAAAAGHRRDVRSLLDADGPRVE